MNLMFDRVVKFLERSKKFKKTRPKINNETKKFLISSIRPTLPKEWNYFDIPNLAPPYPEMWFEWRWDMNDVQPNLGYQLGTYVTTEKTPGGWRYAFVLFAENDKYKYYGGEQIYLFPIGVQFEIPASGKIETGKGLQFAYYTDPEFPCTDEQARQDASELNNSHIGPVLFTIGLMHCKNIVEVEKGGKNPNIKNRRHRSKGTKYYLLDIIPARNIKRTEYEQPAKGSPQRIHFRRGHFKEYTIEKPLFGKYVGAFWWDAHVAGSADIGEVKKDYRILPMQQ
jgi:hypothetical protein